MLVTGWFSERLDPLQFPDGRQRPPVDGMTDAIVLAITELGAGRHLTQLHHVLVRERLDDVFENQHCRRLPDGGVLRILAVVRAFVTASTVGNCSTQLFGGDVASPAAAAPIHAKTTTIPATRPKRTRCLMGEDNPRFRTAQKATTEPPHARSRNNDIRARGPVGRGDKRNTRSLNLPMAPCRRSLSG
jgi:hypothetical protein